MKVAEVFYDRIPDEVPIDLVTNLSNTTYNNVRIDFAVLPFGTTYFLGVYHNLAFFFPNTIGSDFIIASPDAFKNWFYSKYNRVPKDNLQIFQNAIDYLSKIDYNAYLKGLNLQVVDYTTAKEYVTEVMVSNFMKNHPQNLKALVYNENNQQVDVNALQQYVNTLAQNKLLVTSNQTAPSVSDVVNTNSIQQVVSDSTKVNNDMNIQSLIASLQQSEMTRQQSIEEERKALEEEINALEKGIEALEQEGIKLVGNITEPVTKPISETLTWLIPVLVAGVLGMGFLYVYLVGRK